MYREQRCSARASFSPWTMASQWRLNHTEANNRRFYTNEAIPLRIRSHFHQLRAHRLCGEHGGSPARAERRTRRGDVRRDRGDKPRLQRMHPAARQPVLPARVLQERSDGRLLRLSLRFEHIFTCHAVLGCGVALLSSHAHGPSRHEPSSRFVCWFLLNGCSARPNLRCAPLRRARTSTEAFVRAQARRVFVFHAPSQRAPGSSAMKSMGGAICRPSWRRKRSSASESTVPGWPRSSRPKRSTTPSAHRPNR